MLSSLNDSIHSVFRDNINLIKINLLRDSFAGVDAARVETSQVKRKSVIRNLRLSRLLK